MGYSAAFWMSLRPTFENQFDTGLDRAEDRPMNIRHQGPTPSPSPKPLGALHSASAVPVTSRRQPTMPRIAPNFNKMRYILFGLVTFATTVFASLVQPPYNNSKPPKMSLPIAYERAVVALGTDTNQFHCVSATITTEFSDEGWYFTFCSINHITMPKLIVVEFNGKVIIDGGDR